MGRTASGKDAIVNKLCERTGLKQLISYTTRERRVQEGDTHIFATEADYEQARSENKIAAFTQIGSYLYWCTIDQLYEADCYVIDYEGLKRLRELNLPNLKLITVFVNVPDNIREQRAINKRKDDIAKFRKRNWDEREQFREMVRNLDFDYSVSNIELPKAYTIVRYIATVEGVYKNKEDTAE
jgi:guanylate kinase